MLALCQKGVARFTSDVCSFLGFSCLLSVVHIGDNAWMFPYPMDDEEEMTFDEVVVYKNGSVPSRDHSVEEEEEGTPGKGESAIPVDKDVRMDMMLSGLTVKDLKLQLKKAGLATSGNKKNLVERMLRHKASMDETTGDVAASPAVVPQAINVGIVSYGNGVRTSLRYVQEANALAYGSSDGGEAGTDEAGGRVYIDVIDCPCLSETPQQLRDILMDYDAVVFADVCKAGPQFPLAGMISDLQSTGELPTHWQAVGAVNTYNPLGNTSTFLSEGDIGLAVEKVLVGLAEE